MSSDPCATRSETRLAILLRAVGTLCMFAAIAVVMPESWMRGAHARMGMGSFPAEPIATYLARSLSAFSVFYGGLLWVLAVDVRRHRMVIRYEAMAMLVVSTVSLLVGWSFGIPVRWLLIDWLACWLLCAPKLWLLKQMPI